MYREPAVWRALLEKLAATFAAYAARAGRGQAPTPSSSSTRGSGALSPGDYAEFVAPWSERGPRRAAPSWAVPTIHFGTGAATLLPAMAEAGGDVIGLDWRIPLDEGWARSGGGRAVQGNLDPAVLLGPWERVEAAARDVLARAGGRPGHIFNLGHGVLPGTDPDVLGRLRELVHAETAAPAAGRTGTRRPPRHRERQPRGSAFRLPASRLAERRGRRASASVSL